MSIYKYFQKYIHYNWKILYYLSGTAPNETVEFIVFKFIYFLLNWIISIQGWFLSYILLSKINSFLRICTFVIIYASFSLYLPPKFRIFPILCIVLYKIHWIFTFGLLLKVNRFIFLWYVIFANTGSTIPIRFE